MYLAEGNAAGCGTAMEWARQMGKNWNLNIILKLRDTELFIFIIAPQFSPTDKKIVGVSSSSIFVFFLGNQVLNNATTRQSHFSMHFFAVFWTSATYLIWKS